MKKAKSAIHGIIRDSTGGRAGGRDAIMADKKLFLPGATSAALKKQWNGAGRDNARVYAKLSEEDGSDPHFLTGWDGKNNYACYTQAGMRQISYTKLQQLTLDEEWDENTLLMHVRTPILRENMEKGDVDELLKKVRKNLIKSGKGRRKNRFRNYSKYFESYDGKVTASGTDGWSDPHPAPGYVHGRPEEAKESEEEKAEGSGKLGNDNPTADEKGKRELVPVRSEEFDSQLDKREHVPVDAERGSGGKDKQWKGSDDHGKPGDKGELRRRELITMRNEEKERDAADPDYPEKGYWGGPAKDLERKARTNVPVRQEDKDGKGKCPLMKSKKPLVLMMLMKKKKMAEAKANLLPYKSFKRPDEETKRSDVDTKMEARLFERGKFPEHAKEKFLANMKKFKSKAGESAPEEVQESEEWLKKHGHKFPVGHAEKFYNNMMKYKDKFKNKSKKK